MNKNAIVTWQLTNRLVLPQGYILGLIQNELVEAIFATIDTILRSYNFIFIHSILKFHMLTI